MRAPKQPDRMLYGFVTEESVTGAWITDTPVECLQLRFAVKEAVSCDPVRSSMSQHKLKVPSCEHRRSISFCNAPDAIIIVAIDLKSVKSDHGHLG